MTIGNSNIIGDNALLDARSGLTIGNNVNISSNVSIYTLQHDHRDPYFDVAKNKCSSVMIGDRVWLGSCSSFTWRSFRDGCCMLCWLCSNKRC